MKSENNVGLDVELLGLDVFPLLVKAFSNFKDKPIRLLDIGCSDGEILYCLYKTGYLANCIEIIGVDISPGAIEKAMERLPNARFIIGDATNLQELDSHHFDIIICSNVIEHVENDLVLVKEIERLLNKGGFAYVSTCIKKWYGFYFYRHDGHFRLAPDHFREYSSGKEFLRLFENKFSPIEINISPITFPIFGLFTRGIFKLLTKEYNKQKLLASNLLLRYLYKIRVPIIGYDYIEGIFKKG